MQVLKCQSIGRSLSKGMRYGPNDGELCLCQVLAYLIKGLNPNPVKRNPEQAPNPKRLDLAVTLQVTWIIKGFWYPQPPKLRPYDQHKMIIGSKFAGGGGGGGLGLPKPFYHRRDP